MLNITSSEPAGDGTLGSVQRHARLHLLMPSARKFDTDLTCARAMSEVVRMATNNGNSMHSP